MQQNLNEASKKESKKESKETGTSEPVSPELTVKKMNIVKRNVIGYKNMIVNAGYEFSGLKRIRQLFRTVDHDLGTMVLKHKNHVALEETFDEAVSRFNLSESDLLVRYQQFRSMSRIYFLTVLLSFTLGIIFKGALPIISSIGLSMIPLSLWFRWSFRAWQVRIRKLGSPKEFIAESYWWAEAFR